MGRRLPRQGEGWGKGAACRPHPLELRAHLHEDSEAATLEIEVTARLGRALNAKPRTLGFVPCWLEGAIKALVADSYLNKALLKMDPREKEAAERGTQTGGGRSRRWWGHRNQKGKAKVVFSV